MATPIRVCVRFIPQQAGCQTIDWCTNIDLDRDTEDDVFARAELFLAGLQSGTYDSDRLRSANLDCDYAIILMTAFPGE